MFRGSFTALVTPFKAGEIDWRAFDDLVERQIEQGIHGLVPCGTTGESPTLSHDEHKRIVERCVNVVKGRVPVIAGTGSNSTREAIDFTAHARQSRADAALIVLPYYNKPTQEGLYQHYKAIAEAVNIPILIYNIPGRCVIEMKTETMARLAALPNIVGVKDATNDLSRVKETLEAVGPDFCQLSGEDHSSYEFLLEGGHGCISVTSNVTPGACARLQNAHLAGDAAQAARLQAQLMPLHDALFTETSPQPVKYALASLGLCTDEVRLPLVPASAAARKAVDSALSGLTPDILPRSPAHGTALAREAS